MKLINRRKSRPQQVLDLAKGTAKTAVKTVKATAAYKAAKGLVERTPAARRVPIDLASYELTNKPPPSFVNQLDMYAGLSRGVDTLTEGTLTRYWKRSSFRTPD